MTFFPEHTSGIYYVIGLWCDQTAYRHHVRPRSESVKGGATNFKVICNARIYPSPYTAKCTDARSCRFSTWDRTHMDRHMPGWQGIGGAGESRSNEWCRDAYTGSHSDSSGLPSAALAGVTSTIGIVHVVMLTPATTPRAGSSLGSSCRTWIEPLM